MSGILKVGGSELINDNGGSGSLQWGTGVPAGSILQVVGKTITDNTMSLTENSTSQWYAVEKSDASIKFEVNLKTI